MNAYWLHGGWCILCLSWACLAEPAVLSPQNVPPARAGPCDLDGPLRGIVGDHPIHCGRLSLGAEPKSAELERFLITLEAAKACAEVCMKYQQPWVVEVNTQAHERRRSRIAGDSSGRHWALDLLHGTGQECGSFPCGGSRTIARRCTSFPEVTFQYVTCKEQDSRPACVLDTALSAP